MTFRFALQPLLVARERAEDESRAALSAAAHEAAGAGIRAAQLRSQLTRAVAARNALRDLELLVAAVARADLRVRAGHEREAAARAAFVQARRSRRQLSALRDRALAAYRQEAERRETRELEVANAALHNAAAAFERAPGHRRFG